MSILRWGSGSVTVNRGLNSYEYGDTFAAMRTVQMTLDEQLVEAVDRAAKTLGTSRSAFTRRALQDALRRLHQLQLEEKHRRGYARRPVRSGEFDVWEAEQAWPEP